MDDLRPYIAPFLTWMSDQGDHRRTCERYGVELVAFVEWLGGHDVTEARLHAYRRYLQTERVNKRSGAKGLRPRTIRMAYTAIFRWADWLERTYHERPLPRRGSVTLPALDVPQREVPTAAEVRLLFAAAAKVGTGARTPEYREFLRSRALCVLSLLADCGLRLSELLSLLAGDLKRDGAPWLLHVRHGKGAQTRWIPINDQAQRYLAAWLTVRAWWLKRHSRTTDVLFPCGRSRALGQRGLYNLFREIKEGASLGERRFTPHGMRHAFATDLSTVSDLKTVQTLMGHQSAATTLSTYLHTTQDRMTKAVEDLAKLRQPEEPAPPVEKPASEKPLRPETHLRRMRRRETK